MAPEMTSLPACAFDGCYSAGPTICIPGLPNHNATYQRSALLPFLKSRQKKKPPYPPSTREMGYYQGAGSCITGPSPSLLRSLGRPPLHSVQHSKEELEVQMQFNKQQGR